MNCDDVRELLEEYTLAQLNDEMQRTVESHLATCPDCRRIVAQNQESIASLTETLAALSPYGLPASMRAKVLHQVAADLQTETVATSAHASETSTQSRSSPRSTQTSIKQAKSDWRFFNRRLRWAALAAFMLLALTIGWGIRLNVALARERALRAEYAGLVDQQEIVLEVIDSKQTTKRFLRAMQEGSTAYGKLFTRDDMVHVVAMAARLAPAPLGEAYHLWLTKDGVVSLVGVMRVNDAGFGLLIFDAADTNHTYQAAQLTLQPLGSDMPGGDVVIAWEEQ